MEMIFDKKYNCYSLYRILTEMSLHHAQHTLMGVFFQRLVFCYISCTFTILTLQQNMLFAKEVCFATKENENISYRKNEGMPLRNVLVIRILFLRKLKFEV